MQDTKSFGLENPEAKTINDSELSPCEHPVFKSMQDTESSLHESPEAKFSDADAVPFRKSLQELRDLRSQLYHAADYCEEAFLKAKQKTMVVENTKEYICRATVTVVDHLGTVSENLEDQLLNSDIVRETELRISTLKRRFLFCEQYAQKLALAKVRWSECRPRYGLHYIAPSAANIDESQGKILRNSDKFDAVKCVHSHEINTKDKLHSFAYPYTRKPPVARLSTSDIDVKTLEIDSNSGFPVRAGLSTLTKLKNPSSHFQDSCMLGSNVSNKKSIQRRNFLSLLKWNRRSS